MKHIKLNEVLIDTAIPFQLLKDFPSYVSSFFQHLKLTLLNLLIPFTW